MDVWSDGRPLRMNNRVGPEQITWGVIWETVGGRPGRVVVSAKGLRDGFRRDPSTLRDHLEKLARIDIIRLVARNARGEFLIDVYNPCPSHAEAVPNRQMVFPAMWTEGVADFEPLVISPVTKQPAGQTTIGPGRDAEGASGAVNAANEARGFPRNSRGDFPVVATDAGISPRGFPRGDNPCDRESANSSGNRGKTDRGDFPAENLARDLRHYNDNERENLNSPNGAMSSNDNVSNVVIPAAGKSPQPSNHGEIPAGCSAAASLQAEIEARRRAEAYGPEAAALQAELDLKRRQTCAHRDSAQPRVGEGVFADALSRRCSPTAQKARFIAMLRELVCDPKTHDSLFGIAADLLIEHGLSTREDAGEIYGEIEKMIGKFRAFREMERRNGKRPKPIGPWLNKEVRAIGDAHGIETRKRNREYAGATQ